MDVLDAEDDGEGEVAVVGCVEGGEEVDFDGCWVGYVCAGGEGGGVRDAQMVDRARMAMMDGWLREDMGLD